MFKQLKQFPKYEVSSSGEIRRIGETQACAVAKDRYGHLVVLLELPNRTNRFKRMRVATLVLMAFNPPKIERPYQMLTINFIDGNKQNVSATNLEWDLVLYTPTADALLASSDKLKYIDIPDFPGYQINIEGIVRDASGNIRRRVVGGNGYLYVAIVDPVVGIQRSVPVHRLMALAFLGHPKDTTLLVVNHKDGNVLNNTPDNLEWTTHSGNNRHAVENKLANLARPVLAMKVSSREVTEYFSLGEFSRVTGTPEKAIWWRLKNGTEIRPYHGYFIKYKDDKRPWPGRGTTFKKQQHEGTAVEVKDLQTKNVLKFESYAKAGKYLGKDHKSIMHQALKPIVTKYLGRYLIRKVPVE